MMRTTEQLKDSGGLAAIARLLKVQHKQQTTTAENEKENDEECNDDDEKKKRGQKRRRKEKKKKEKEKEKETKKEFKGKTSSKSDDDDVNDDEAEDEKRRRKKGKSEEEVLLDSLLTRVDPVVMLDDDDDNEKMLKRIRAKLKFALEANVLHFSKRASGITKNASVTAERAHAWRQAVRGYGDEENDERGPGNIDSVLNVFKAMSDVLMAIVSVDSKCSDDDDDSDDDSEIVKKYSPFALQLRALSTKAF